MTDPYYADDMLTLLHGDCIEVMRELPEASVDAVVTDPPYGLEFMGKEWDSPAKFRNPSPRDKERRTRAEWGRGIDTLSDRRQPSAYVAGHPFQSWCTSWATEALRVTKPGGYLLAFGGTRTHHRLVCGLEDAGWIIRDELDWIYASGFPKGKANLKPAHEPIVLARKPGPLQPLGIDAGRIAMEPYSYPTGPKGNVDPTSIALPRIETPVEGHPAGRWPSNVLLSDPELFDQPNPEVVGSGAVSDAGPTHLLRRGATNGQGIGLGSTAKGGDVDDVLYGDTGGYSRFYLIPKASRSDREPVLRPDGHDGSRISVHPTVKPVDLMRHLVRLVTPSGGTVLDCFLGSGSTAIAAGAEGFRCIGIEREEEYLRIAVARLAHQPLGLGLDVPAPVRKAPKGPFKEDIEERGYDHAVNDPEARSDRSALFSGLAEADTP